MVQKNKRSYYIISSSESDTSDHDTEETTTQKTSKMLIPKQTCSSSEHQLNKSSRLKTPAQNSNHFKEINQSNTTISTVSEVNNDISEDIDDNSIHIDDDDAGDDQQNLSSSENSILSNEVHHQITTISTSPETNNNIMENNNGHFLRIHDDHNKENSIINVQQQTNNVIDPNNLINGATVTTGSTSNIIMDMSISTHAQSTITQYFSPAENPFEEIANINENTSNMCIRCKIIYKSPIRYFGNTNKVFDGIVCDMSGETKIVAFNEDVNKFYDVMIVNKTIKIENGKIEVAKEDFRSPYSIYQIRLMPSTIVEPYNCLTFQPLMKIDKQLLINIPQKVHGSTVDIEGKVVSEQGIITTTSQTTGHLIRRKSIKIKDETNVVTITIWSNKIDDLPVRMMHKTLRIRNGRVNHYGDYITINVSQQTIIEIID